METSLGSGKQFSTVLQMRSGEAPPTLYCTKDLKQRPICPERVTYLYNII